MMLVIAQIRSVTVSLFPNDSTEIPILTEDLRDDCEGKLGYSGCYSVLQTFQKKIAWKRWPNYRILPCLLAFVWTTIS